MRKRKPFNVSRVYGGRPREESGASLVSSRWGVFEDPDGRLVATWPTKREALEAARQLNEEEEKYGGSSAAGE
ncbi:MAG TPA: DUF2188 domain-containing protein [Thermoanaerobaculia bacterium]|jgi:hypothetical protein|nr:DUF2188 domain-containing protein [Thermoanaerobaculia bacterium]